MYSVSTLEAWDQKLVDDIPGIVANLGLQTALFSWIALASSFRALYHHEWIPSTIAFLCYTLFGQLIYYQNSPLILYPATMVTNLVSVTKFFLSDIYGTSMGSFCYNLVYRVPEVCTLTGNFCEFQPLNAGLQTTVGTGKDYTCTNTTRSTFKENFRSELVMITPDLLDIPSQQEQLIAIANTTVSTGDVDCSSAKTLNLSFLIVNYMFVGITLGVLLVLIKAEFTRRSDRHKYRQRYFMRGSPEGDFMVGVKMPHFLIAVAAVGFVVFQCAKLHASLNALESTQDWPLIDLHNQPGTYIKQQGFYAEIKYGLVFNMNGWLPTKKPYINIETILLIVTTMSVIRGGTRQSVSAFRMASVSSALYVITSWPVIVGNMENMAAAELWPWQDRDTCNAFFTGKPFMYPSSSQSKGLCVSTQLALFGSLVVFIAMNLNIFACLRVFVYNKNRQSMTELDLAEEAYDPIYRHNTSMRDNADGDSLYAPLSHGGEDFTLPAPTSGSGNTAHVSKI